MYASREDIQAWLANDKIFVNDANSNKPNIEATRTIRAQLTGTFAVATLNTWADPNTTPELIRSIAGRLAAAFLYRERFSEDDTEVAAYAQQLYSEAISMLQDIKTGALTVVDDTGNVVDSTGANILGFWPDDGAPKFTMDDVFA